MNDDRRIPVIFAQQLEPDDAVLAESGQPAPPGHFVHHFSPSVTHLPGCLCCGGRSKAAAALSAAFRARATGEAPFFRRLVVLASPQAEAEIIEALSNDALCQARYRLEPAGPEAC